MKRFIVKYNARKKWWDIFFGDLRVDFREDRVAALNVAIGRETMRRLRSASQ